ncbi:LOW QUALITY PROTEIN: hypothetical protein OSB04_005343 [Centaurea solstitialis]|uniref:Uncharacterized protein n=1 Tax=Centaurea solstitialis TaxID=347529 RepID=A0AA38U0H4_9ASTR|nr:LOW QUALITY PROTEIN: hypothetical protein OSB04_005343 [Centaurea solstitialis]
MAKNRSLARLSLNQGVVIRAPLEVYDGMFVSLVVVDETGHDWAHKERRCSVFNPRGANSFNSFITTLGLIDPSLGVKFLRSNAASTKHIKLDQFLLLGSFGSFGCPHGGNRGDYGADQPIDTTALEDLRQKSKCSWLQDSDENSRFLHNIVNNKRKKLDIHGLAVREGWKSNTIRLKFSDNYEEISYGRPVFHSDKLLKLSVENSQFLKHRLFFSLEMKDSCGWSKAPSPDGYYRGRHNLNGKIFRKISRTFCRLQFFLHYSYAEGQRPLCLLTTTARSSHGVHWQSHLEGLHNIDWDFLSNIPDQTGFWSAWISWVKGLISLTKVSVTVNRSLTVEFMLKKGTGGFTVPLAIYSCYGGPNCSIKEKLRRKVFLDEWLFLAESLHYTDDTCFLASWSDKNITGCKEGKFPFGPVLVKKPVRNHCLDKFSKRLNVWKVRLLSFDERLTLCKTGGGLVVFDGGDKLAWVAWDKVLNSREIGGLDDPLWKKVIISLHDRNRKLGEVYGGHRLLRTWGKIASINSIVEDVNLSHTGAFSKHFEYRVLVYDLWWGTVRWKHSFLGRDFRIRQRLHGSRYIGD